jgi:NADPH:quinone reductase-like Zn-dependent oxidoreductase
MKAFVHRKYGSPETLKLEEVEKPSPKDNEVLIKVKASSVNPLDWHVLRGSPYFIRFQLGLFRPKNKSIGADMAGIVEAVGSAVTGFKPGDEVFSDIHPNGSGGFGEYVSVPEEVLVLKPSNISFEEAAAIPIAGLTALQGLRDHGKIEAGKKVLINGASGGVGTYAVQIAKSYGAEVTAVCSTRNQEQAKSIGADHLIDYSKEDFTQNGQQYDLIFEGVGNKSVKELKRALSPNGIVVMVGFSGMGKMFKFMMQAPRVGKKSNQKMATMLAEMNQPDMSKLGELLESGTITSIIDKKYPLEELPEAIAYVEEGHARGKVVISL